MDPPSLHAQCHQLLKSTWRLLKFLHLKSCEMFKHELNGSRINQTKAERSTGGIIWTTVQDSGTGGRAAGALYERPCSGLTSLWPRGRDPFSLSCNILGHEITECRQTGPGSGWGTRPRLLLSDPKLSNADLGSLAHPEANGDLPSFQESTPVCLWLVQLREAHHWACAQGM